MTDYNWITKESKLPWLVLDIDIPYKKMHAEAIALKKEFVKTMSKTNSTDFADSRRDRGGTEAGPQSAIKTVAGPRRDPLTPFGLLK